MTTDDASPRVRLEERDVALLCALYGHGAMLRGQAQRLFFPNAGTRRCNRRLRQLFDAGYVERDPLPLGPHTALSASLLFAAPGLGTGGQLVYRPGRASSEVLALRLQRPLADIRRHLRAGTPTALAHALETVSFRIALAEAAAVAPGMYLARFIPERLARHAYRVRETGRREAPWREEVFKPDAMFEIFGAAPSQRTVFALEIDLGHTATREFLIKLAIHRRYLDAGLFAKRYGAATFTTLVSTTGPARRDRLRELVDAEGTDLFWLATFADVAEHGPLAAVWHVPGRPVPVALADAGRI